MSRKVYLDFQDGSGWRDISDLVKYDTLQVHTRAFSDNFHFAQNNATFQVIYDSTIYPLIKASTKDILVNIFDLFESTELTAETDSWLLTESGDSLIRGTVPIFYGHVPFTKSRTYNGILNNTHYSLEAIDDIDYLDVKVGDICYVDYKIMDSTDTAHSIVHQLAYIAGWTDARVDNLMTISNVISYFVPPSEEDLVKDLLDTLLFEYGYSLNINEAGQISPIKWRKDADDPVFQFNNGNIVKEISIQDSLNPYDSVEVTYYELAQASTEDSANILLYRDSNLPYSDNGGFLGYPVPSGYLYPPETNVIDTVTGSGQIVYQDYDDTALKYWTNEAIVNKLDYNYKAFKSDYSDILYTSDHFVDYYADSNISLVSSSFGNKKARVVFSGSSSTNNNLYYFNIYGKVIYKSAERKAIKNNITDPSKTDRYVSTFIYDATTAEALTLALAAIYDAGNTVYTMTSDNDRFLGENSQVYLGDGTNQNCILMEKIYDEATELWTFVLKAYSKDIGTLDQQTSSLAPRIINNDIISASIIPNNFSVPALIDGSIPNLTGASTELTVYRGMFDDSMGWSYSATVSGVSGSFGTGLQKNIYTVSGFNSLATTQGSVVITASRTGFNDVSGTYVINKIFQSDATTSGMVNDQIVATVPVYAPRYYGKYQDTTPSGSFVTGDSYCRYSTSSGTTNRGIFKWDGDSWERTEAVADVTKALTDVSFLIAYTNTSGTAIYGTAADYSGDSTVQANFAFFQSAMIGYLEAENIKIRGSLRVGDRYTISGTIADDTKAGIYQDGATGEIFAAGITFQGSLKSGVQWGAFSRIGDAYTFSPAIAYPSVTKQSSYACNTIDHTNKKIQRAVYLGEAFALSTGTLVSDANYPAITQLSRYKLAMYDTNTKKVRVYTDIEDGSFTIRASTTISTSGSYGAIRTIIGDDSYSEFCLYDVGTQQVRMLSYTNTVTSGTFSALGTPYTLVDTGLYIPSMAVLDEATIAILHRPGPTAVPRVTILSWDGAVFSEITYTDFPIVGGLLQPRSIVELTSKEFIGVGVIDTSGLAQIYSIAGNTITQNGPLCGVPGGSSIFALAPLSGSSFAMIADATDKMYRIQADFSMSLPYQPIANMI